MSDTNHKHDFLPNAAGFCKQVVGSEICHRTEDAVVHQRPSKRQQPLTIEVTQDGNKVAALIGENLQEGVAGFGDTLADALRDLAENLEKQVLPSKY